MTQDQNFEQRLNDALKRNNIDLTGDKPIEASDDSAAMSGASSGLAMGMRISMEFLVGTLVGMAIGWGIDKGLGTTPWFLLIFTVLGFGAGIMNVYRAINNIDQTIGVNRQNVLTNGAETPKSKPTD